MGFTKNLLSIKPYLQVAIDIPEATKAFSIAQKVVINNKIILEAGTPLIKTMGLLPVKIWSAVFKENPVLADMKTMDTGYLEAKLAFENGALITTVLGVSDNATIKGAVDAGIKYNRLVQVDMMNVPNIIERSLQVYRLGANIIGLHAGIDQQGRGLKAVELTPLIKELKKEIGDKAYISIAGGIKEGDVEQLVNAEADIIVIGSYITKSSEPKNIVKRLLRFF